MNVLKKAAYPYMGFLTNMACAVGYSVVGFLSHSWWFITIGAYDAVLAAARFCVLHVARDEKRDPDAELFAKRVTGLLLIALSICLVGINILSAVKDRGTSFHEIIMIAIAVYTFTKITLAIIGMVKARRCSSLITKTLRNISFATSVVSIYSLQRSMLVSFPGMAPSEIQLFNILTGAAVTLIVLLLGINLLGGKYVDSAKARITTATHTVAGAVASGYRKMEHGVIKGYKEAKARLHKEIKER